MKTALGIVGSIRIASPCPVPWETMEGDDRARHCSQCDRHVYNLSAMSPEAAISLIGEKEGDLCVQLWRRKDGTVLTADCPVGVRQRIGRVWQRVVSIAASLAAFLMVPGCEVKPAGQPRGDRTEIDDTFRTGGKMCFDDLPMDK